jgi:hypothetical protein
LYDIRDRFDWRVPKESPLRRIRDYGVYARSIALIEAYGLFCIKESRGGCISDSLAGELKKRIEDRTAVVAVVVFGYVGLPLIAAFHPAGFHVIEENAISNICYLKHLGVEPSKLRETLFEGIKTS